MLDGKQLVSASPLPSGLEYGADYTKRDYILHSINAVALQKNAKKTISPEFFLSKSFESNSILSFSEMFI